MPRSCMERAFTPELSVKGAAGSRYGRQYQVYQDISGQIRRVFKKTLPSPFATKYNTGFHQAA